jgi:K+-sensing histidine kinase KdpD
MSISQLIHENYDAVDDDEKKMGVKKINQDINHIYALLENLLTWSRSQTGQIKYHAQECDLSDLIKININLYMLSAHNYQIRPWLTQTRKWLALLLETCLIMP